MLIMINAVKRLTQIKCAVLWGMSWKQERKLTKNCRRKNKECNKPKGSLIHTSWYFSDEKNRFVTALDLIKCLNRIK